MDLARDIFTVFAILLGALFFVAGTTGLLRFPDALTRLHALTKIDNLALGFVALGLAAQVEFWTALKIFSVWVLVQLSGATVTQLVASLIRQKGRSP